MDAPTPSRVLCSTNTTHMRMNMANWDRVLRVSIAIGIAALYFTGILGGTLGLVLLVLAVVFVGSSALGVCPMYSMLGIGTRRKKPATH